MSEALARIDDGTFLKLPAMKEQIRVLDELLKHIMIKDTHYGTIPGTPKPTLYKPGSEKILSTFRIAADPNDITDLSTEDEIRYRVRVCAISQATGVFLGAGIGECSSDEEKYKWRKPVCREEFEETPIDRKREVWKKGGGGSAYKIQQVRMNPKDVANTILKMAKKRGQIDMTLTVTAASDVFDQDLEDLPEGMIDGMAEAQKPAAGSMAPKSNAETAKAAETTAPAASDDIAQLKADLDARVLVLSNACGETIEESLFSVTSYKKKDGTVAKGQLKEAWQYKAAIKRADDALAALDESAEG